MFEKHNQIIKAQENKILRINSISEQYIYDFLGKEIIIMPKVFSPSGDTKLLVKNIKVNPNDIVLECCSGTGAIAIHIANKVKEIHCTDISPYSIKNINANAKKFNLNINFYQCNLFPPINKKYDVIIINPPYTDNLTKNVVEQAFWDKDHKVINDFLINAKKYLTQNGKIYLSWADFADFDLIENLFTKYIYKYKEIAKSEYKGNLYKIYELTS